MSGQRAKRKRFLVDRKVQGALGARIACHWMVFIACSVLVTSVLRIITSVDQGGINDAIGSAIREQIISIGVLLSLLPWFLHDSMKLSNRFAGPMVRLRDSMRQLRENEPSQTNVKFRDGDFWLDIAAEFNLMKSRIEAERAELEERREAMAQWHAKQSTPSAAAAVVAGLPTCNSSTAVSS